MEDIELNVIVARSVLEKLGNSVEVAMNGHDALAMFDPDEFDLVLLDIQLPDMTGLDIARVLRERYAGQALPPLVALTANVLKDKKRVPRGGHGRCAEQAAVGAGVDPGHQTLLGSSTFSHFKENGAQGDAD